MSFPSAFLLYSLVLCLYFIRTCVFVLIVLHFAFFVFIKTRNTQTSMPPARLFLCSCCLSFCHFYPLCHSVPSVIMSLIPQHTSQTSMPPARFEPATPASDRPQTLVLDRSATGIIKNNYTEKIQFVEIKNICEYLRVS